MDVDAPLVFVHSYDSRRANWRAVVFGDRARPGRLRAALKIAGRLNARLLASDADDQMNIRLYRKLKIRNLGDARTTRDEVRSLLAHAPDAEKIVISSPDHLPRIVRDAFAMGGRNLFFAASATPYTARGAAGVAVYDTPEARDAALMEI